MQSALGTPQTTLTKLRFSKFAPGTDVQGDETIVHLREGGDGMRAGFSYKQRQVAGGQIVFNARPEILGQALPFVPGGATWDGGSAPPVHTFHTGHASFPWGTLLVQHPGSVIPHLLSDVRFRGMTMEWGDGNNPIKVTMPFLVIQHGASFAAVTPSYAAEQPFLYAHSPSYQLDGAADTDIIGFTVAHTFGIDELQAQAVTLDEAPVMNAEDTIEIRRRFENATLWKKVYMGGGEAATVSVATGSLKGIVLYDTGANLKRLEAHYPLIAYESVNIGELDPDGRTVIETISGRLVKGATHHAVYELRNAHASAYLS